MTEIAFPDVFHGELADDELLAFRGDLQGLGTPIAVRVKPATGAYCSDGQETLESAFEHLMAGRVSGVQLTYRHEAIDWLDTLIKLPRGYRLVRARAFRGS